MLILSSGNWLFSQTLRGEVKNAETMLPVPFATVFAPELSTGTTAGADGKFIFTNFPTSQVTLKISAAGYDTKTITFTLQTDQPVEEEVFLILLNPAHIHLDEVVVSTPFGKLQNENVTNVESIRLNDINRIPSVTLSDAISTILGIYVSTLGNGIGKPVIRGMSGTRVVTYLNGLRIENQQWGDDHGMGVTDVGVEGVEVIKGPASLLYGSDALGGVMYFINSSYAKLNLFEMNVSSAVESNSLGSANQLGLKWNKNGLKINFFGGHVFMGDYMLPNGYRVDHSRFSTTTSKLSIGYNRKRWVGNLHYSFLNSFIGLPGHSHEDSTYAELFFSENPAWLKTLPYQFITNHYTLFEQKLFFEKSVLEIYLGNTINRLREFEEKNTIPGIDMNLISNLYNIRYKQKLGKRTELLSGVQGMVQLNKNNSKAEEILIPDYTIFDAGLYLVGQYQLNKFLFQGGARYDFRLLKADDQTQLVSFKSDYESFNYSAGFAYQVDSLTFRLNVSSGFRSPHVSELLSDGIHHGTFRYIAGNELLKNENALQIDFTMGVHYDHMEITFNPFFNEISNYIYLQPADSIIDGYQVFEYTQTNKAQLFGGDFAVHVHPHFAHWLHVQSSFHTSTHRMITQIRYH
ncbi:MAG: TonB-dependent receptor [Crocinitomicaceae bacterium]|nr:TonB-dependent receptor [Crocinitomicaceae bacterium]